MILAYAIIALIILALLLRRNLRAIGQLSYRGNWKLAVVLPGLFVLQWATVVYATERTSLKVVFLILSHLALILLILINRHLPGAKLFALGVFLNTAVMVANGGWMPITPETYRYVHPNQTTIEAHIPPPKSKNIILPRAETKLWILSDMIPAPLPWRRYAVSIGDLLLVIGVAQFLFKTTKSDAVYQVGPPLKTT